jgi:hypothetical protein
MLFSTYCERFWEERLKWFEIQAQHGLIGEIDYHATGFALRDLPASKTCPHHISSNQVRPMGNCPHGTDQAKTCIPQESAVYGVGLHSLRLGSAHSPPSTVQG